MRYIFIILFSVLFLDVQIVHAEECVSNVDASDDFSYPETLREAKALAKELCLLKHYPVKTNVSKIKSRAEAWKNAALAETAELKHANINLQEHIDYQYQEVINGEPYKAFDVDKDSMSYSVSGKYLKIISNNDACITLSFKSSCYEALEQFRVASETVNSAKSVKDMEAVYKTIGLYSDEWGRYFTKARSQTVFELGLNTYLFKDELKKRQFVLPPDYQAILLHPSIAYEYVSDAEDGEQGKEALMVEWLGVNFWNAPIPFGASIISTYSDRRSVDDDGHGVMIHLFNNYSIGYTKRGGVRGVLVTIDLLKMFESKKDNLYRYKDDIKRYVQ